MRIISAIGSFKGSIDSTDINTLVKNTVSSGTVSVEAVPVADGGDGLLDSLCFCMKGEYLELDTVNALGEPIKSKVGLSGKTGIVEMALASGLALLKQGELNPLKASTYGTGVLIKQLALMGVENVILGIGGSATNDGGFGCLNALGYSFYNDEGELLAPCGENLQYVCRITEENVCDAVKKLNIQIACDVTNPLLGCEGATYIYGRQKGADEPMLALLEKGMANYSKAVAAFCGKDYSTLPGTGAAGGLGFGLMALLGATLNKGAEIVLRQSGYDEMLRTADLVITGEGRLDNQTAFGKLPQIVASKAKAAGVKCVAICGSSIADRESLDSMGISQVYQLIDYAEFQVCMNDTERVVAEVLADFSREQLNVVSL